MYVSTRTRRVPRGRAFALVVVVMALFGAVAAASAGATTYTALGTPHSAIPTPPGH